MTINFDELKTFDELFSKLKEGLSRPDCVYCNHGYYKIDGELYPCHFCNRHFPNEPGK